MTNTVTVSIGRNVGDEPMVTATWRNFVKAVENALSTHGEAIHVKAAKSTGEWNGITEESRTWVAEVSREATALLAWDLSALCKEFHQEAIAMSTGATAFVTPNALGI